MLDNAAGNEVANEVHACNHTPASWSDVNARAAQPGRCRRGRLSRSEQRAAVPMPPDQSAQLRTWRDECGLSRRQVAEILGVSPSLVAFWESGRARKVWIDYILLLQQSLLRSAWTSGDFRHAECAELVT